MMDYTEILREHCERVVQEYGQTPITDATESGYLVALAALADMRRHELWHRFALRQTEATEQIAAALTVLAKAAENAGHPVMVLDSKAWGDRTE